MAAIAENPLLDNYLLPKMYLMRYVFKSIIWQSLGLFYFTTHSTPSLKPWSRADQRRFYKRLLTVADARYDDHLRTLSQSIKESQNGKKTR